MMDIWKHNWINLRGGLALTLLGWGIQIFHNEDPQKKRFATALLHAFLERDRG